MAKYLPALYMSIMQVIQLVCLRHSGQQCRRVASEPQQKRKEASQPAEPSTTRAQLACGVAECQRSYSALASSCHIVVTQARPAANVLGGFMQLSILVQFEVCDSDCYSATFNPIEAGVVSWLDGPDVPLHFSLKIDNTPGNLEVCGDINGIRTQRDNTNYYGYMLTVLWAPCSHRRLADLRTLN